MKTHYLTYWLTSIDYYIPKSDSWKSSLSLTYVKSLSLFKSYAEAIADQIKKDCPARYAVVTDVEDYAGLELLNSLFIPNNIIKISAESYDVEKVSKQIEWVLSDFGREKNNMNIWITSDTHFSHKNIIKYCNRPWNSGKDDNGELIVTDDDLKRMDEALIANWNSVVKEDDIVWHLGDFYLGPKQHERIPEIVTKLHGKINLVLGNHDRHPVKFYYDAGFHRAYDRPVIINSFCILSHAPLEFVKAPFLNIYGHVHDCSTYKTWSKDCCCVCVERHDYKPISLKDIEAKWKALNVED